ncbi:MAG: saccharopine dehydrogenase C-terminal domain-containing protein, partial [Tangfeifania sp.]
LILGAGMVAKPLAEYLLKNNIEVTMASRTKSKAEAIISEYEHGTALEWQTDDLGTLDNLVSGHDLIVSLLPYEHHVRVASFCIRYSKNMVTTSYVSKEMQELDKEAKNAGILLLNEIGVDPGFDHMTAMRIIDKVHESDGKVKEFYSLCGALPAPEEADNPLGYKFSWSPRGVLKASKNGATYSKNGQIVEIPTEDLFKNPLKIDVQEVGTLEVYPNRDSLIYTDLYNIQEAETIFRGTFRFPHWCETLDVMKKLGLLSYEKQDFENKSYKQVIAEKIGVYPKNVKEKIAEKMNIELDHPAIVSLDWLGYFDNEPIKIPEGSAFDLTAGLMTQKMMLPKTGRDMVVMLHSFLIEKINGEKMVIKSQMVDFATAHDTSISRTVALPAAIAVKLILGDKIDAKGVRIPVDKTIYEPVLKELEELGISMQEKWNLQESEKLN